MASNCTSLKPDQVFWFERRHYVNAGQTQHALHWASLVFWNRHLLHSLSGEGTICVGRASYKSNTLNDTTLDILWSPHNHCTPGSLSPYQFQRWNDTVGITLIPLWFFFIVLLFMLISFQRTANRMRYAVRRHFIAVEDKAFLFPQEMQKALLQMII